MEAQVDSKIFHKFQEDIARSMRLPLTSRRVIAEFVDVDVNAEAIAKVVGRNQYYENMLLQEIKAMGLKENTPSIRAAISLFGMTRVRNFICAVQMWRVITRKHPELDKDGKVALKPSDMLTYAIKTEEYVTNRKLKCGDTAFAAGMMFDILIAISVEVFDEPKGFKDYVGEIYKHGLKTAMVSLELSKTQKNFGFAKYAFAACLIHDVGKLAMDLLYPATASQSYIKFRDDLGKKPVSRDARMYLEAKRFGLTHEYYSAILTFRFELFRSFEKAILFHHDPYLLKKESKDLYQLANVIALSSNIASNFRTPKDTNDPVYDAWFTPELSDFKVDRKSLLDLMTKIGREAF